MPQYYDDEFKKKIVRLKLEEGRTAKSIISGIWCFQSQHNEMVSGIP